ncbi:hypothetical protein TUM12126_16510 [Klebsiella pneumoniae]|nr:O-antigen export system ATP-binding protein RfbB [Klebsiella pneumoniae]BCY31357.1 hypothetical protein TUM12126_16510 [Klebsiella pneumoniae]
MFAGKKSAQIREILISESAWEEMTCLFAPSLAKLGFSVISQVEPDILIIDEVLAVGDIAFQAKCIQTIRDFKKRGVTILFVSHNMSDVEKICDRVIWIENHRLREVGSADRIIELYKQAMA